MPRAILKPRIIPESAKVPLTLEFDGEEKRSFQLAFDVSTLVRIEERSDVKNAMNPLEIWVGLSVTRLLVMFWAAVATLDKSYDSEEGLLAIRSFLTQENIDQVGEAVFNAHQKFVSPRQREVMEKLLKAVKEGTSAGMSEPPTSPTAIDVAAASSAVS